MDMPAEEKNKFLKDIDLETTEFQIKIDDFGLSKKINDKEDRTDA